MVRLKDGDRAAFHPVFTLAWPMALRFARAALGDRPEAEDAAQQGLLRLFEQAYRFDPGRDASPWILAFVANQCRTQRRRNQRQREAPLPADSPSAVDSQEDALVRSDLERAAREALDSLQPGDVETILASFEGSSFGSTFRKRLERARRRLREAWVARHAR